MLSKNQTFLIVGLGLIGGSYAMALHRQGYRVTALDKDEKAISYALSHDLIDEGGTDDEKLISEADVIVSGLYPKTFVQWVSEHQVSFKAGAILTDVSGVKRAVIYPIQAILREDVEFIASHPMAGREVGGVWNSTDAIFKGANFLVVPSEKNTQTAIGFAEELGRTLGFSRISVLSPEEHDQMVGYLSQLTHVIAVSLMNANDSAHFVDYTGDSFRDLTRIAKINETLWTELFFANEDILVPEIDGFVRTITDIRDKLVQHDEDGLKKLMIRSTERRRQFDR